MRAGVRTALLGGKPWSPLTLSASLLGLWDAERADRLTLAGSLVTTWADAVAGYAPTQGVTGAKPSYSPNSFNGRPGITFDGVDDELTLTGSPFPTSTNPCEIWALVDQAAAPADTTSRDIFGYGAVSAGTSRRLRRVVVSAANRAGVAIGASTTVSTSTAAFTGRHVIRGIFGPTSASVSIDGGAAASAAYSPNTSTTMVRFGAATAAVVSNFFQGTMNCLLVTSALDNSQSDALLAYLKARGGIS